MTLNLSHPAGQDIFLALCREADVVVENFRPGTLERWNIGPDRLLRENPRLVIVRTTAFGQTGPYSQRPGFGTLAEALSGFAHITGSPDGPPTLPPFGLADGIAALAGAIAVLIALFHRDARGGSGQVVDLAIIEPILTVLGSQPTVYDQLGIIQGRTGNRSFNNAPRNTYRTSDGRWVAVSTSATSVAERVMRLVGRPDVIEQPWFKSGAQRAVHADELDGAVAEWVSKRDRATVLQAFEDAEAAAAPVNDVADVLADPQYRALDSIVSIPDEDLGQLVVQNVLFRMLGTPGAVRWGGRRLGQDTVEVLGELGITDERLASLQRDETI
jgi:crotonobetainyl-CoA:carnitine CoA-transferase CaiB-like acyl-CoA transferase